MHQPKEAVGKTIANVGSEVFEGITHPNPRAGLGESQLQSVIGFVFVIVGIISVIMIIIGGYNYVLSGADPQKTKKAKETILYAVIGLVISMSAWLIVSYVLDLT